jgi:exonuclease SbcD
MRILHTSDWHLGRIFHGIHLTEDQACLLDQLVLLVKDVRPEIILIAGDVYDRSVPPHRGGKTAG